jgi:hypothetical protein
MVERRSKKTKNNNKNKKTKKLGGQRGGSNFYARPRPIRPNKDSVKVRSLRRRFEKTEGPPLPKQMHSFGPVSNRVKLAAAQIGAPLKNRQNIFYNIASKYHNPKYKSLNSKNYNYAKPNTVKSMSLYANPNQFSNTGTYPRTNRESVFQQPLYAIPSDAYNVPISHVYEVYQDGLNKSGDKSMVKSQVKSVPNPLYSPTNYANHYYHNEEPFYEEIKNPNAYRVPISHVEEVYEEPRYATLTPENISQRTNTLYNTNSTGTFIKKFTLTPEYPIL